MFIQWYVDHAADIVWDLDPTLHQRAHMPSAKLGDQVSVLKDDVLPSPWLRRCQATLKTEPLPTSKTEPPLAPEGRLFSESFRLGLIGGWFGACSSFS
jgi:hypothetical protein